MSEAAELHRRQAASELHRRLTRSNRPVHRLRRLLIGLTWAISASLFSVAKRLFDSVVALVLLTLTLPIWISLLFHQRPDGSRLVGTIRVGRWAQSFQEYSFSTESLGGRMMDAIGLRRLPSILNILRGQMSFIGPRAVSPGELSPRERIARRRYDVRPGLIGLWWVRERANIGYEVEAGVDAEYVESQSLSGDVALALRAIPSVLYGADTGIAPDEFDLVGIRIHNLTMTDAVETMLEWCAGSEPHQVAFVNADCANIAWRNRRYFEVLRAADLSLGDGIGIKIAAKALGLRLKQNVNGTDLFPRLCAALEGVDGGIFLLGARPGVAEAVAGWINTRYPRVTIAGFRHGYFSPTEEKDVTEEIRASGAAILLVAFGAPRQDEWIRRSLPVLGVKVAMGVGGLFDFYSGRIARAPQWLREMGLEWTYRLYQEPGRMWRRYLLGNLKFLYHIALHRISGKDGSFSTQKGFEA